MLGMTKDQWMGIARQVVPILGGMAVALGWLPESVVLAIKANLESILAAISTIVVAGSAVWAAVANSKTAIVTAAANIDEVREIKTEANAAGKALAAAAPDNVNPVG